MQSSSSSSSSSSAAPPTSSSSSAPSQAQVPYKESWSGKIINPGDKVHNDDENYIFITYSPDKRGLRGECLVKNETGSEKYVSCYSLKEGWLNPENYQKIRNKQRENFERASAKYAAERKAEEDYVKNKIQALNARLEEIPRQINKMIKRQEELRTLNKKLETITDPAERTSEIGKADVYLEGRVRSMNENKVNSNTITMIIQDYFHFIFELEQEKNRIPEKRRALEAELRRLQARRGGKRKIRKTYKAKKVRKSSRTRRV